MWKLGEWNVPRVLSDSTLSQVPICLAPIVEISSVFLVVPPPLVSASPLDSSDFQKNVCFGYIYPLDDGGSDGYPRCICNYYMYYISVYYLYLDFCIYLGHGALGYFGIYCPAGHFSGRIGCNFYGYDFQLNVCFGDHSDYHVCGCYVYGRNLVHLLNV